LKYIFYELGKHSPKAKQATQATKQSSHPGKQSTQAPKAIAVGWLDGGRSAMAQPPGGPRAAPRARLQAPTARPGCPASARVVTGRTAATPLGCGCRAGCRRRPHLVRMRGRMPPRASTATTVAGRAAAGSTDYQVRFPLPPHRRR
jgi:hypothetical protein